MAIRGDEVSDDFGDRAIARSTKFPTNRLFRKSVRVRELRSGRETGIKDRGGEDFGRSRAAREMRGTEDDMARHPGSTGLQLGNSGSDFSSQQRGILKKELMLQTVKETASFIVRRVANVVPVRGKDLTVVWLSTEDNWYLMVVTTDSWVQTGAYLSKVLPGSQVSFLDVVRLYERTSQEFWVKIITDIEEGRIVVGWSADKDE